jgi:hypothetical protein
MPTQEPEGAGDLISGALDTRYLGFSDDLSKGVNLSKTSLVAAPNTESVLNIYLRDDALAPGAGDYQLLSDCPACTSPLPAAVSYSPGFAGGSADFGQVIFESPDNLTSDASGGLPKLYEWDHGTVRLAGVLPDDACGSPPCPAASSAAGRGAGTGSTIKHYTPNTISRDGSRTIFTSPVDEESKGTPESRLYLRENHATTAEVSASERTLPSGTSVPDAKFWAASADLSKIFFTSREQLTDDDDASNSSSLYSYDASLPPSDPHNLTLVSADSEPDDGLSDDAEGAIGASEDGDYVYFYSISQLIDDGIPGTVEHRCSLEIPCLYVWHDGTLRQVGSTSQAAEVEILGLPSWSTSATKSGRVTRDGTGLVFLSDTTPGGDPYDHGSGCSTDVGIEKTIDGEFLFYSPRQGLPGCAEVYVYSANANGGAGELTCASCPPGGTHLTLSEGRIETSAGSPLGTANLSRAISDDGRYVFFSTGERLVREDTNGQYDVYEYDTVTGKRSLLSSGESDASSFFLEASPDGKDVFFLTHERLSGWDRDGQVDLYDARVNGGVPDPPPPPPGCEGDACQPPPLALNDPTPGSSSFAGPGNPSDRPARKTRRCGKGERRLRAKGGKARCVKKQHGKQRTTRGNG